jgi:signal transduction histidine kinase
MGQFSLEPVDVSTTTAPSAVSLGEKPEDFERLLSHLSAAFIRVSVDQLDSEIERWLERIVLAMGVDRSTVYRVDTDGLFWCTHQWARPGIGTQDRGQRYAAKDAPWLISKIRSGEIVVISRMIDLPPEAWTAREGFLRVGTRSNVTIPLRVGGLVVGALLFGAIFSEKRWTDQEVQRLKLVAEIFGNAFERKRTEAEIRRLSEELRQATQVMTMGELTASLAHELNQPLGAILNNAKAARRLLTTKKPDLAEIDDALDDIIRDDARAVDIIRNVRALFQRGETKMSPVELDGLLQDVARIVTADARMKRISWSMELADSLPLVRGDKTHLTQAVLNLVLNAFDAVTESAGPRRVTLRAARDDHRQVRVSVSDSGKGIDPSVMPRLFDPFYTTKPAGMGMGLTVVRSIVENHGGRIWATSNSDCGATFEFVLPVEINRSSPSNRRRRKRTGKP